MLPISLNDLKRSLLIFAILLSVIYALPNSTAIAKEAYKIPDDLIPVSQLTNGYTNEQALKFRRGYSPKNFVLNDDIGTYLLTHMSEILPAAVVLRDGPISELKSKAMPQIADVVAETDLGKLSLRRAIEDTRSRIRGYIVVHKGKIVFEEYPGMQPNDIHLWYSSAKVITGLLIHMIEEDGLLDLNKPITTYIPEFAGTDFDQCSVLNVLQHEAGMDFVETHATVRDPKHPVGRANAMLVTARGTQPGESLVSILKTVKSSGKPGQAFDYSTFNTQLLKLVIEHVTKKPWEQVVSERIWSVAGMEGDALNGLTPTGEAINLFASRLRDKARFGLLFTPSWKVTAGKRVVSDSYFTKLKAAGNNDAYLKGELGPRQSYNFHADPPPIFASYHWDAVFEDGDLYKDGRNGQGIYVSPETDTVVAWFSSSYNNSLKIHSYARAIVLQLFRNK